jgi:hypothetical protein
MDRGQGRLLPPTPEQQAREAIDRALVAAGWVIQGAKAASDIPFTATGRTRPCTWPPPGAGQAKKANENPRNLVGQALWFLSLVRTGSL